MYGLGQIFENVFLTPRLIGERIGLHPSAVIFALLAFGRLFGFFGVLLALPASAILAAALRELRHRYLASELYQTGSMHALDGAQRRLIQGLRYCSP